MRTTVFLACLTLLAGCGTDAPTGPPETPQLVFVNTNPSVTVQQGMSVDVLVYVSQFNVTTPIALSMPDVPIGVTAAFAPPSLIATTPLNQSTLTLTAAATAPLGSKNVLVVGLASLTVGGAASMKITVTP